MELNLARWRKVARIFWPAPLIDRDRADAIEADARYLVQKVVREEAALLALHLVQSTVPPPTDLGYIQHRAMVSAAQRRADAAVRLRRAAVIMLRHSLDLPDLPTLAEIDGWGIGLGS